MVFSADGSNSSPVAVHKNASEASEAGEVLVSCKLQWVSSQPRQTRSVQAMLARYVVQIVLTCLDWYFFLVVNTFIKFFFWHCLKIVCLEFYFRNFQNPNLAKNLRTSTPLFQSECFSTASLYRADGGNVFPLFATGKHQLNLQLRGF